MRLKLLLLLVLLTLSALFSGSETAYFSLRPSELARLADRGGTRGVRVVNLLARTHTLLSALLIGNLLVNTIASVVATALCVQWFGENGLVVAVVGVTIALLLFGEITPKLVALRFSQPLALAVEPPVRLWMLLIQPVLRLIEAATDHLLHWLPLDRVGSRPLTSAELQTACDLAVAEGTLTETEGHFLARLLLLQQMEVREIMTPRPDVVTVDAALPREQILSVARQSGRNRYPVTVADKPLPTGFFHIKDLLGRQEQEFPLQAELRPLIFVPESKDVAALLTEMRTEVLHLAAVVDEHGDFSGIVTLADCLQALTGGVGELSLQVSEEAFQVGRGHWVVAGGLDLRDLQEACGIILPPSRDYVTVGGFVMARLGRIPAPGDRCEAGGACFTVLEMDRHRIVRIQVELPIADIPGAQP